MKNILLLAIAALTLMASCKKEEYSCTDYQLGTGEKMVAPNGVITFDCTNANQRYAATYIKNEGQPDWTSYTITPHTDIDKFWLNNFYYAVLDKSDLTKFTIPIQQYTVPGVGTFSISSNSYGDIEGNKLHIHIYIANGANVTGEDWIGYRN